MKQGKSLVELATELQHIKDTAVDMIAPVSRISMNEKAELVISNGHDRVFTPNNWSHQQMAGWADIPKAYYDRLKQENPGLLATNFQHAINLSTAGKKPESKMIRTVDGQLRAFLSSRYRRLDSYDLLETVLPVMQDSGMQIISSEMTDRRLYLKAITPRVAGEIKKGDAVNYGIVISSSDVGAGSVRIEPMVMRLVCTNGLIMNSAMRKYHIGRETGGDEVRDLITDQTQMQSDLAFWMQVRDIVQGSMRRDVFDAAVDALRDAASQEITNFDLPQVVDLTMKKVAISGDKVKESVLQYLARGGDGAGLNKYGLSQAFSWAAEHADVDYDMATELERAAGTIIELPRTSWKILAEKVA
jgi:hypothetical protein